MNSDSSHDASLTHKGWPAIAAGHDRTGDFSPQLALLGIDSRCDKETRRRCDAKVRLFLLSSPFSALLCSALLTVLRLTHRTSLPEQLKSKGVKSSQVCRHLAPRLCGSFAAIMRPLSPSATAGHNNSSRSNGAGGGTMAFSSLPLRPPSVLLFDDRLLVPARGPASLLAQWRERIDIHILH
jgi:hypothetical protein